MDIDYNTVSYVLKAFVCLPIIIATLFKPHLLLYPLILLPLFQTAFPLKYSIGSVNVYAKDLVLALYCLSLFMFLFRALVIDKKMPEYLLKGHPMIFLLSCYLCLHIYFVVDGLLNGIPLDALIRRFIPYFYCIYFFLPIFFIKNNRAAKPFLIFIAVISMLYPVWQICLFICNPWSAFVTSSGTLRLAGSHGSFVLAMGLFSILIWRKGLLAYLLATFPLVSILLIGHRSFYLGLAISLTLLFILVRQYGKFVICFYLGTIGVASFLFLANVFTGHDFIGELLVRSSDTLDFSNPTSAGRLMSIKENWHVFLENPFFGIGYNYEIVAAERCILAPHNFVMKLLSNTGIFGFMIVILIIASVLKRCLVSMKISDHMRGISVFLFCSIVYFLVISLMNTTFSLDGYVFWVLCGLTVSVLNENGQEAESGAAAGTT